MTPVLVIDDEPLLWGRKLHGVRVAMPSSGDTLALLQSQKVEELLVSPSSTAVFESARSLGRQLSVPVRMMHNLQGSLRVLSSEQLVALEAALSEDTLDLGKARALLREVREGFLENVAEN
jgi:FlaA1/EpsC-like NDP-sugar epimerase